MLQQKDIYLLLDEIVEAYQPEKIYLYGSYANGVATEDSDLDLFILKETNQRPIERMREVKRLIKKNYPKTGLDIIVYTPFELQTVINNVIDIGKIAITTGKLLYERNRSVA